MSGWRMSLRVLGDGSSIRPPCTASSAKGSTVCYNTVTHISSVFPPLCNHSHGASSTIRNFGQQPVQSGSAHEPFVPTIPDGLHVSNAFDIQNFTDP